MKELDPEEVLERVAGQKMKARGKVPADLALFQDHFPGFPVLPGVLALEILKRSIEMCLGLKSSGNRVQLAGVENVRFQYFLRPGEAWESDVLRLTPEGQRPVRWKGRLTVQGKSAVNAQLTLAF